VRRRGAGPARDHGQASIELVGALPALLALGLGLLQMLAVGYTAVLAASAAEAGALAHAAGHGAEAAARRAVPGWSREGMRVGEAGGIVRVTLAPPSALAAVRRLEVHGQAAVAGG
jgi:hypothetical protein